MTERRKMTGYAKQSAMRQVRTLNIALFCVAGWLLILVATPTMNNYAARLDAWANPIVSEFTSRGWYQVEETGHWRAHITGIKEQTLCFFDRNQEVSGLVQLPDGSTPFEIPVTFVDDDTPNSDRPPGFQSFGIWEFHSADIGPRSVIAVNVRHLCYSQSASEPVVRVSTLGPFTIR